MRTTALLVGTALAAALPAALHAQQQAQAPTPPPLEVGAVAPDFALAGATRFGVLQQPVRLSDYRGEVVVLAFFFKARTKG
ncbi:MAG: redoxin domain-containing protein [Gemmatimonadetes bacterium]|nr:redoxin domain-containing protein [Gemmatimonadota bacterium]